MAVKEKIRIRIKGYDHQVVDQSAEKIVQTAKRTAREFPAPSRCDREADHHDPQSCAQVQGQPRAVRDENPQETYRHLKTQQQNR